MINNATTTQQKKLKIKFKSLPPEVSLLCWYFHQELGTCLKRLKDICPQDPKASIYWHMKSTMVSSSLEMNLVGETIHPEKDKKRIVTSCWNWTSRGKQLLQKINYQHVRYEGVWRKWVMTLNNAFKKEFCWRRI